MVRDAEAHSEEDAKFEEFVTLRNQGDALVHASRKTVTEAGDKATDEEKEKIEAAATELEEALKTENKEDIEAKIQALSEASGGLAQKMYEEQAAADAAQAQPEAEAQTSDAEGDVVDADFEEVKDTDKS